MAGQARVAAILGPTNTGKTHYAIERMLGYRSGMIGLPLRLLAREVYDKIVSARGPSVVALVTGEERIVPPRAQYWVCTVESMPEGMGCDFVGIDEIQLCADPERGHVFTDRLLRMRGTHETLFMGSDTMRGPIAELVKGVEFVRRERMSQLSYTGSKKISRLQPRTAIVGFSVENVYAIAELLRRQKGGAAVVMEWRGRFPRGNRRHWYGPEPRYQPCRFFLAHEIRRTADATPDAERTGADRGAGRARYVAWHVRCDR